MLLAVSTSVSMPAVWMSCKRARHWASVKLRQAAL